MKLSPAHKAILEAIGDSSANAHQILGCLPEGTHMSTLCKQLDALVAGGKIIVAHDPCLKTYSVVQPKLSSQAHAIADTNGAHEADGAGGDTARSTS